MMLFEYDLFVFVTYFLFMILHKNKYHSLDMFEYDLFVFVTYCLFILYKNSKYDDI